MKLRWVAILAACALALTCAGCQKKTTRKVTLEGPEKKTEIKVETTEKGTKDADRK